jgi:acyl phosphate:glycerol-3-phosphate acyltransferase
MVRVAVAEAQQTLPYLSYTRPCMDFEPVRAALLVLVGYLTGSLPMGVIVARLTGGRDPRTVGSGRIGGTNALRAMGAARGLAVGLLDIAKGAVPVAAAVLLGASPLIAALTASAAVAGAWRSIFLGFHGGRGLATGIGGMLVIQPLVVLLGAPVFFGTIWLTRYVSVGSLAASASALLLLGLFILLGFNAPEHFLFAVVAGALVWLAHAENIGRLRRGEERRFEYFDRDGG